MWYLMMLEKSMRPNGQTILIVDDEPTARTMLRLILVRAGYRVVEAVDGRDALDKFLQTAVDLILLDVMMPGIDGIEVCERIRANEKTAVSSRSTLPIIMLSAKTDSLSIRRGLSAGADEYLTKPISPSILLSHLQEALTNHHE